MKLCVQHKDGRTEILTLVPPLSLSLGEFFNVLTDGSGKDHYFYPGTGFYDGWGMTVTGLPPEEAGAVIDRVEADREIEP